MASGKNDTRINIRPSDEVLEYLDDLVKIGIYGKTRTEVAKTLVYQQIERLIKERILVLRK